MGSWRQSNDAMMRPIDRETRPIRTCFFRGAWSLFESIGVYWSVISLAAFANRVHSTDQKRADRYDPLSDQC